MILKRQETEDVIKSMYDSSNVLASSFDKKTNNLTVIFAKGKTYLYEGVNSTDYMRFEMADSQGKVLNSHIKKYVVKQLDDIDPTALITEAAKIKADEAKEKLEGAQSGLVSYMETMIKNSTTIFPESALLNLINSANKLLSEIKK